METEGGVEMNPISAREFKNLTAKKKSKLKMKIKKEGKDYDDFIEQSQKLFPGGGVKKPIKWRNK